MSHTSFVWSHETNKTSVEPVWEGSQNNICSVRHCVGENEMNVIVRHLCAQWLG
jgi:hypothetical protein